jgi:hypothetical protein
VRRHLEALRAVPAADLIAARYRRLRATGAWLEAARS